MDENNKKQKNIAVALKYEENSSNAPVVVAKGRGYIAEQIIKIAQENGINIHKDADLAEILEAIDINSEIPLEAFSAVAEILAYMYRMNGKILKENQ